jgi:hypothetical protein
MNVMERGTSLKKMRTYVRLRFPVSCAHSAVGEGDEVGGIRKCVNVQSPKVVDTLGAQWQLLDWRVSHLVV